MIENIVWIVITIALVLLNGFFVAAEFALVKVRMSRIDLLVAEGRAFAGTARWLAQRLDQALAACQLGITMASLGLGWIGEPAIARLIEPVFRAAGITSAAVLHTIAFIIGFTIITAAHLLIGEQAPKIFAIREPEKMSRWCAVPLKWFFILSYPLLILLNAATSFLLRKIGIEGVSGHDTPHSEEEIRALLSRAHAHGELTRSEHKLLNAVFDFDDTICRKVMVPRVEVIFIDLQKPAEQALQLVRETKHTRYPVCEGSMDQVRGFVHIKDMIIARGKDVDLTSITRPPRYVPEGMRISRLLGQFQASHQHMAFVVDEYGSVVGIVTLENVLESIVGPVQDEFDAEMPDIVRDGPGRFIVQGGARIDVVSRAMDLNLSAREADTLAGLLMERSGAVVVPGDRVQLDGAVAEVLEADNARATRIRLVVEAPSTAEQRTTES